QFGQIGVPDIPLKVDVDELAAFFHLHQTARFQLLEVVGERRGGDRKRRAEIAAGRTVVRGNFPQNVEPGGIGQHTRNRAKLVWRQCGGRGHVVYYNGMFQLSVASGIEMRLFELTDAPAVFEAVERNRERLREWLPWVDH